jgi:hypothetical protein
MLETSVEQKAVLTPSHVHEFAALKFIPQVAGHDEIRLTVLLCTASKIPLGKWSTVLEVTVEEPLTESGERIRAGGDVFIFGSDSLTESPVSPGNPRQTATWQRLPLQPDHAYNRRVAKTCPPQRPGMPPVAEGSSWLVTVPFQARVQLLDQHRHRLWTLAVVVSDIASFGRGGPRTRGKLPVWPGDSDPILMITSNTAGYPGCT